MSMRLSKRAARFETELTTAIARYRSNRAQPQPVAQILDTTSSNIWTAFEPQFAWQEDVSTHFLQKPDECQEGLDDLEACVMDVLSSEDPKNEFEAALDQSACIRPLLSMQSRLVHRAVLTLLFDTYHLKAVFIVHRETFLFGQASFVSRLKAASFERRDMRSTLAVSKRGIGLGLNTVTGIAWPPSSSDLSLNLMGVLDDVGPSQSRACRLSFAVRELSDTEIEKVCNPTSVHALDFIRLQCNTSSPLDTIFTPATSKWYDEIFSSLLLHTRMLHMVTSMRYRWLKKKRSAITLDQRSRMQAHCINTAYHTVATIAAYATQVAVDGPWQELEAVIQAGGQSVSEATATGDFGLDRLSQEHQQCLGSIRRYLFIGRRYEEIRDAQSQMYDLVLHCGNTLLVGSDELDWTGTSKALIDRAKLLKTALESTVRGLKGQDDRASEVECEAVESLLRSLI